MKKFTLVCFSLLMIFSFSGCSSNRFMNDNEIKDITENPTGTITFTYKTLDTTDSDDAMTTRTVNFVLYYENAPITVTNFIKLVNDGFYNLSYCQDFTATNTGSDNFLSVDAYEYDEDDEDTEDIDESESLVQKTLDYTIKGEFSENGWTKNDIEHLSGIMSMVRGDEMDSANFQFMICMSDFSDSRDGNYAAFGKIDKLESAFLNDLIKMSSLSAYDFQVVKITVDTKNIDFGTPLMIKS